MARSRRRASRARASLPAIEGRDPLDQQTGAARPSARRKPSARRRGPSPVQLSLAGGAAVVAVAALVLLVRSAGSAPLGSAGGSPDATATVGPGAAVQGQPAPDFTGTTFDGQRLSLSDLRGKPVLVNFFASWCTSCEHELPAIQQEYLAHKDQGFTVLGVNTLENGDGARFYHRMALTFPAVRDPGQPGRIGAAYNVTRGLPASVFIDRNGNIDRIYNGEITAATIEAELKRIG